MSKIGTADIKGIMLGSTEIVKAYLGSDVVFQNNVPLPYDAEIEYLESTGTQWINTGHHQNTRNFEIKMRFQWCGTNNNKFETFIGYMAASSTTPRAGFHKYTGKWMFGTGVTSISNVAVDKNTHDLFWTSNASTKKENVYIDDVHLPQGNTSDTGIAANTLNFYLFARNRGSSVDNASVVRIYSINYKVFDNASHTGDPIDEFDFIPVRVGTTGYMYDKKSKQLFGNSGTGNFTLGADKN